MRGSHFCHTYTGRCVWGLPRLRNDSGSMEGEGDPFPKGWPRRSRGWLAGCGGADVDLARELRGYGDRYVKSYGQRYVLSQPCGHPQRCYTAGVLSSLRVWYFYAFFLS